MFISKWKYFSQSISKCCANMMNVKSQWPWPLNQNLTSSFLGRSGNLCYILKKIPQSTPEISRSREWDASKVTATLNFDTWLPNLISSSLSPSECFHHRVPEIMRSQVWDSRRQRGGKWVLVIACSGCWKQNFKCTVLVMYSAMYFALVCL